MVFLEGFTATGNEACQGFSILGRVWQGITASLDLGGVPLFGNDIVLYTLWRLRNLDG